MNINSLLIKKVRCFEELSLSFSNKVVIVGKNGSGKTSILESIYFIINGRSFRTTHINEMINEDNSYLYISSKYKNDFEWLHDVSCGFDRDGSKKILLDGELSNRRNIMEKASIVIHSPEDMNIIDGPPSKKRDFLDRAVFLTNRSFFNTVVNYKSYLKQKKILLRNHKKKELLYINRAIVTYIEKIREERHSISEMLYKKVNSIIKEMSIPLSFDIKVEENNDNIEEKLQSKLEQELQKGHSLYGPHLDNVTINILHKKGRSISMGEKAIISLILKFAEVQLLNDLGINSLFLGDDIMAFVDKKRSDLIFSYCSTMDNQFILSHIDKEKDNKEWEYIKID